MSSAPAAISPWRTLLLALLRIAIGWHFLYEGVAKLLMPGWSAVGYLKAASGPLASVFYWMTTEPAIMKVVDQLNIWGLICVGVCLMLGLFTRLASLAGIGLLALYYASNPPLFAAGAMGSAEGHYLLVNKNLVEAFALLVVIAFPARLFGLDGILSFFCCRGRCACGGAEQVPAAQPDSPPAAPAAPPRRDRRALLTGLIGLPVLGGMVLAVLRRHGWFSHEESQLAGAIKGAKVDLDAIARPTQPQEAFLGLDDLKGKLPISHIGPLKVSRVLLGGNLIGGWAHARDLIYVSRLIKAYHTRSRVFQTLRLAEACGVNTIITNPVMCEVMNDYWRREQGAMQFISDCGGKDVTQMIQKSIDHGAAACYIQGGIADKLVEQGDFDTIEKALEMIRRNKIPAGIGGHKLATIRACVERGYKPDFWMKTLHHQKYWSARPGEKTRDNNWCEEPEDTIAFMKERPEPWIAFKVMAAGAIHPRDGFRYAFENGADFVCAGMYDFQIVEDVNIALDILNGKLKRGRQWIA